MLNIVYSLLLVPVFLSYWGDEKYGHFLALYGFVQLMRTLDTGHQVYVGNEFNRLAHYQPDQAYKVLSGSMGISLLLGLLECLAFILLWFSGLLDQILAISPEGEPYLFLGMMAMMLMWWTVGSAGGVLARIILAKGLYSESVLFAILLKFIETSILLLALFARLSISTTFILLATCTILYSIVVFRWTARIMPEYFPWWKEFSMKTGFRNFSRSLVLTVNGFLEQFNNVGLLFLINKFFAAGIIPVFTTVRTLTNTMTSVTNLVVQPLVPEMIRFESEGRKEKIWKIIEVNWLISGSMVSFGFLFLVPAVDMLFSFWTKGQVTFNKALFYMLAMSVLAINFGRSMTSYLGGINDLRSVTILTTVRFVLVFGLTLLLIPSYGLLAFGIGVFISEFVCSIILPAWFVYRHLRAHQFEPSKLLWATMPVLILGMTLWMCYTYPETVLWFCGGAAILLFLMYTYLWQGLEEPIKSRLVQFARSKLRRFRPA